MIKVITGNDSLRLMGNLNSSLRTKTREKVERLDNCKHLHYTPWLCSRTKIGYPLPEKLISTNNHKGKLVTNRNHLEEISSFLNGQCRWLIEGLPSTPDTWQIMVSIEESRPDAIKAFEESLVVLDKAPFVSSMYHTLVDMVIPLQKNRPSGFDSNFARGATFRAFPEGCTAEGVAFELAHAAGHQAALLLSSCDLLITSGRTEVITYTPRHDEREAIDAFYSVVALGYMTILFKALPGASEFAQKDPYLSTFKQDLPPALVDGVNCLREQTKLTALASAVLNELEEIAQ